MNAKIIIHDDQSKAISELSSKMDMILQMLSEKSNTPTTIVNQIMPSSGQIAQSPMKKSDDPVFIPNLMNDVKNRDIVFGYFKVPAEGGDGMVCVALKRPPRGSESREFFAAFSFCSPEDNFSSKVARTRTLNQLANGGSKVLRFDRKDDKLRDIFVQALKLAMETEKPNASNHLPYDDRKIAPRWLLEYKDFRPSTPVSGFFRPWRAQGVRFGRSRYQAIVDL